VLAAFRRVELTRRAQGIADCLSDAQQYTPSKIIPLPSFDHLMTAFHHSARGGSQNPLRKGLEIISALVWCRRIAVRWKHIVIDMYPPMVRNTLICAIRTWLHLLESRLQLIESSQPIVYSPLAILPSDERSIARRDLRKVRLLAADCMRRQHIWLCSSSPVPFSWPGGVRNDPTDRRFCPLRRGSATGSFSRSRSAGSVTVGMRSGHV